MMLFCEYIIENRVERRMIHHPADRLLNRRIHEAIHLMAHSRVMAQTSSRMWDLSDFLINTTGSANR